MSLPKAVWSVLFRLFPCPVPVGLHRVGNPGRESPVLLTCNFYLTVERLKRVLRGTDAWLLGAEAKGVNVWCAAGGDEFSTQSVVSALKTSGIAEQVDEMSIRLSQTVARAGSDHGSGRVIPMHAEQAATTTPAPRTAQQGPGTWEDGAR